MDLDVLIVGGGPAGCSAALVLGRCRRRVLVIDNGRPRNAASRRLNAFVTRDGVDPAEFLRLARTDALRYPGVRWRDGTVADARCIDGGFEAVLDGGERIAARKILIATGVVDELPPLDGVEPLYGRSVHHCPYCDGWEHRDGAIAVYGRGDKAVGLALMMTLWSDDVVLCSDGPDDAARADARLARRGVRLVEARVRGLDGDAEGRLRAVLFRDGTRLARDALFFHTGHRQASALAERLGCKLDARGEVVRERPFEETSVSGAYVIGDATKDLLLVVVAAAEGAEAAFSINRALLADDLRGPQARRR